MRPPISLAWSAAISYTVSWVPSTKPSVANRFIRPRRPGPLIFVISSSKIIRFADGNKRIGTLLFLEYLRRNRMLVRPDGRLRLADNATVALALLVAESDPAQKDLMI